jgi:pyrroline-5-carboxylate reductase
MSVKLVVIGGGTMAQAIVRGGLDARQLRADEIVVVEPDSAKRAIFESWRVRATDRHAQALAELAAGRGAILLAVKPQVVKEVADQLREHMPADGGLVISILAGTPTKVIRQLLGAGAVVRAMPNTAEAQVAEAERLLGALGPTVRIDESLMDAFTALAGSGPAYLFYLAEAMTKAALAIGFDASSADQIVRQTLKGAAALLDDARSETPANLRAAVTSKGGTTEAAVRVLDDRAVMQSVVDAITRARDRGQEISGG